MNITAIIVFIAGLALGTLLNIVVIRLPKEHAFGGWPRCTRCGRSLSMWQLLPLVGWLAQRGRGRCCGRRLDVLFPLIELGTGIVMVIFYLRNGLTVPFFYVAFVAVVLIITGAIDWLHRSIYTLFVLGPTLLILIVKLLIPRLNILESLVGALTAGLFFALMFVLAKFLFPAKSAPFGLGDVYLSIFIGAAVGFTSLVPALFYGMLLAGVVSALLIVLRRAAHLNVPEYISYGTFLCLGALGYLLLQ